MITNLIKIQRADNGFIVTNLKNNNATLCMSEDRVLDVTKEIISQKEEVAVVPQPLEPLVTEEKV